MTPEQLEQHVGKLITSAGAFFPGERVVFKGHDLHQSLKSLSWLELYLFGITGRRFTPQQINVLQGFWCYTSYPDARLWNNRVAALAGTVRSTGNLGIAAALAISEAHIYGSGVIPRSIEFLIRAKSELDSGKSLKEIVFSELKIKRGIAGYGRPVVSTDERIKPILAVLHEQGLDNGAYLKLAYDIEKILLEGRYRLHINYAALAAALAADCGLSPREYYFAGMLVFLAGMPPCYLDAVENPEGTLFPIPCRMVSYEGKAKRTWPLIQKSSVNQ